MTGKTIGLEGPLYDYYAAHAYREPEILKELRLEAAKLGGDARMQIGPEQGAFMAMLVKLTGAAHPKAALLPTIQRIAAQWLRACHSVYWRLDVLIRDKTVRTSMPTRTYAFVLATALITASVSASAQSIGGKYSVAGTNLDGTTYGGTAAIALTSETTCVIKWVTGEAESEGICMRNGDSFAAGYVSGDITGLVIYKVLPDGTLNGLWTIANNGGAGTEVLTPVP